ncbi:HD-GYP domain-containing protein [Ideonella sp.]|uniref:HD-GYP domain-containing protein n=1 Tax=Ideonella sp. TaxID=1929293 RepID=UPI002B49B87A|nr:HD domain-containing phosphohydrolase [Ideonella sp.]HJV70561.1 HD domain-containing phosphohydrolase [Ideonella sp.]
MTDRLAVNEHYLNRVVAVAESAGVEATEDIVTGNGIKLVAKGARIDARSKDRLLQHKLLKPLETTVRVVDGIGSRPIDRVADELLSKHALLAGVCGRLTARVVTGAMRDLRLSTPLESLLSIYAAQGPAKLEHAVGVSLLSAAMAYDLPDGSDKGLHTLMVAGLAHDVGELYIDPAILQAGLHLSAEQWKHVAAHPIVAAHVLRDMPGAGAKVAEAVQYHHERLDGFGYPHGLRGALLPISGQVLALAEVLMGLIESGRSPGVRAAIAVKLIPGEVNRELLGRVCRAAGVAAASDASEGALAPPLSVDELAAQVSDLQATLERVRGMQEGIAAQARAGSAALKELLTLAVERCHRIHLAFTSSGLDTHRPDELRERLAAMESGVHLEATTVLREVRWRLREVKREVRLRAERLAPEEGALVRQLIDQAAGRATADTGIAEARPSND